MSQADDGFDVFLSHNSRDKPAVERIGRALRDANLAPWLDKWQLTPGGDWQNELSDGLRASRACAYFIGPHGEGDWARQELAVAMDRAAKERGFRLFPVLLPGVAEPFTPTSLPPFLSTRTWVDLRPGILDPTCLQTLINAILGVASGAPTAVAETGDVPYRGLHVFDEDHARYFFGRDADVQRLLERLKEGRFLVVLGPSGSGKSSVVRAGLIPALRAGRLPGSEEWMIRVFKPGPRPLTELAAQLAHLNASTPIPQLYDQLAGDKRMLDLLTAQGLTERGADARMVWVVDQFEEVFTLCRDDVERAAFIDALLYAAAVPGGRTVVVLTMRSDFYSHCAAYDELAEHVAARQYLVSPMDLDDLRRVIEEPARLAGLELEAGLTERILADIASEPGALPLLEHALLELWERRRGRMLTLEAYQSVGGVHGALAQRAETIFGSLAPAEREIARRVLLRLTQPGEGTDDTRRRAGLDELVTRGDERDAVERVLQELIDARLLTATQDQQTSVNTVDVVHEALIRGWPRLRAWVDEDRAGLREHHRLTEATHEWNRLGRDTSLLYRGLRLDTASEWSERNDTLLNDDERAFVAASRTNRDRERRTARRRVIATISGLVVALLIISGVALYALSERDNAQAEARQRATALGVANARATTEAVANQERDAAQSQGRLASSRGLAALAQTRMADDPELAVLLAVEAVNLADTEEADLSLRTALSEHRLRAGLDVGLPLWSAAFSPTLVLAALVGEDDSIRLWDWETGATVAELPAPSDDLRSVQFSPDGTLLVTGDGDGLVQVWDWSNGTIVAELRGHTNAVNGATFSDDGELIASASNDGTVRVWNWRDGTVLAELTAHTDIVWSVDFSPDGTQIITSSSDNSSILWEWRADRIVYTFEGAGPYFDATFSPDGTLVALASSGALDSVDIHRLDTGERSGIYYAHHGPVWSVDFSADGEWVVSAAEDGTVFVWEIASFGLGRRVRLAGHTNSVTAAAFSPDDQQVLTASLDGTAKVWNWRGDAPTQRLSGHTDAVYSVAYSPDGAYVASVSLDNRAIVWDLATGQAVATSQRHTDTLQYVAFSPDGRLLVTASSDRSALVWDWQADQIVATLAAHTDTVRTAVFSPDGNYVVTAGADRWAYVWDWRTQEVVARLEHSGELSMARFSPDGTLVATSGDDGVAIWNWRDGQRLHLLDDESGYLSSVAFSSDGALVASGASNGSVSVWDWRAEKTLANALIHIESVYDVTFAEGNRLVLTGSDDGSVNLWQWGISAQGITIVGHTSTSATGILLPDRAEDDIYGVALSPDGRRIVVGGYDPAVRLYDCELCQPIADVLARAQQRVTRALTEEERRLFLPDAGAD